MIRKPSVETVVLSTICVADLLSTIFLVSGRGFVEGNPLMSFYLAHGVLAFVAAKMALFVFPLFIAEWARQHRPEFVKHTLRACICAYLLAYGITFTQVNGSSADDIRASGARPVASSMVNDH